MSWNSFNLELGKVPKLPTYGTRFNSRQLKYYFHFNSYFCELEYFNDSRFRKQFKGKCIVQEQYDSLSMLVKKYNLLAQRLFEMEHPEDIDFPKLG